MLPSIALCNFSSLHLELRRECKEDYMKAGESKEGIGLHVNQIMCSLEGGYALRVLLLAFQRCVHLDAKNNRQGLLKNLSLKKLQGWGMTTHHDLPSKEFMIYYSTLVFIHIDNTFCLSFIH